ncbi:MAG: cation diffusion facilitator family transporter [Calditrichia bacterium]
MAHDHLHIADSTGKRLFLTMMLNILITAAEIVGGIVSGSLSLISDAMHNFSDAVAVIISYIALRLKEHQSSYRHTFGLKRAEIFAAVINASVLIGISIYLFYEAVERFLHPHPIQGTIMTVVASVGLVANILGVLLLRRDSRDSMNIRSTYLHLFADVISSLGVLVGGIAILAWNVYWVDPVLTILIGLYILKESFQILTQSVHVLMEGAPENISPEDLRDLIENLPEVRDIHHIHLWMVGENDIHMEGHVNVQDMKISEGDLVRQKIEKLVKDKFGISHITLQFECNQCPEEGLVKKQERPAVENHN